MSVRFSRVLLVTVVLVVQGCSCVGPPPSPGTTGAAPTGPTVSSSRPEPKPTIIDWLEEFTPAGGGGPPEEAAHFWFMKGDCATTLSIARATGSDEAMEEPYKSLYEGAAAACLAAFHGRSGLWRTAVERFEAVGPASLSCWDHEVYRILKAIVEAHRANPAGKLEKRQGSPHTDCPELTALVPDHGPRDGGYTVEVTGRNLPATLDLYWFGPDQITTGRIESDGRMMVVVPAAAPGQPADMSVKIANAYRMATVYADFRYDNCPGDQC